MDELDYWRLCDELNIVQAALLVAGVEPIIVDLIEGWDVDKRPKGYEAAKTAITNALRSGKIEGEIIPVFHTDFNGNEFPVNGAVSLNSRINVESLRTWLASRGFREGFFFPTFRDDPDYLDTQNPRYAPKLAAAVRAWEAVTDAGRISPKKALDKWLREHASQFDLTDEEGNPVNQAIEECSKIANWQPSGGAPKTPSG